jgi:hypothetical protein
VAQSIKRGDYRGSAVGLIAEAQAQAGRIPEAIQLAQSITDEFFREQALHAIIQAQAKAVRIAETMASGTVD